jgi:hypothetical protein
MELESHKGGGGEMALPNRMSLRPGLLWLTLDLALIIQCLSPRKMFSRTPGGTHTPV